LCVKRKRCIRKRQAPYEHPHPSARPHTHARAHTHAQKSAGVAHGRHACLVWCCIVRKNEKQKAGSEGVRELSEGEGEDCTPEEVWVHRNPGGHRLNSALPTFFTSLLLPPSPSPSPSLSPSTEKQKTSENLAKPLVVPQKYWLYRKTSKGAGGRPPSKTNRKKGRANLAARPEGRGDSCQARGERRQLNRTLIIGSYKKRTHGQQCEKGLSISLGSLLIEQPPHRERSWSIGKHPPSLPENDCMMSGDVSTGRSATTNCPRCFVLPPGVARSTTVAYLGRTIAELAPNKQTQRIDAPRVLKRSNAVAGALRFLRRKQRVCILQICKK